MGLPLVLPQDAHSPGTETGSTKSALPPASPRAESGAAASQYRCPKVPKSVMRWLDGMGLELQLG